MELHVHSEQNDHEAAEMHDVRFRPALLLLDLPPGSIFSNASLRAFLQAVDHLIRVCDRISIA
jgi:hypothetical protein